MPRALAASIALVLLAIAAPVARAQTTISAPPSNLLIDGNPDEWTDRPTTLTLIPATPAARGGRVWVAQSAEGLIIAARVSGPAPNFAKAAADMAAGDHVELWVTLADEVALPEVGWGNQFGPVLLESADACAKNDDIADDANAVAECRTWYMEQQVYRRQFRKLFVRQWQLAPALAVETFARPAFAQMPPEAREKISALAPSTAPADFPTVRFAPVADGGYGFEVVVPWSALPPSPTLDLGRLRLMLDVFSPGRDGKYGPFSSTAAERKYAEVATMTVLRLDPVRHWRLSDCGYPLTADDQWGEQTLPAYFFPLAGEVLRDIFVIENDVAGYQYTAGGYSPVITPTRLFSQRVTPDLVLCGPPFAVRRSAQTRFIDELTLSPGARVKAVNDGWLIAQGPFVGQANRFGSGACGACPTISLQVLFLPAANSSPPVVAFNDTWLIEDEDVKEAGGRNARVTLSDDLMTITAWEGEVPDDQPKALWTRIRKCYDGAKHLFADCAREENVKPPLDIPMPPEEPAP